MQSACVSHADLIALRPTDCAQKALAMAPFPPAFPSAPFCKSFVAGKSPSSKARTPNTRPEID